MFRKLTLTLCSASLALAAPAVASEASAWEAFEFMRYNPVEYSGDDARIDLLSESASSLYYRKLSLAEREAETLNWSWKIEQSNVAPTPMDLKKGDDRLLGLYVFFTNKPYSGNSIPRDGKFLSYVWGSSHPEGSLVENHNKQGKFIVTRKHNAPRDTWYAQTKSFKADFKKAFGFDAHPAFIAVIADTDDTKATTKASLKAISFE